MNTLSGQFEISFKGKKYKCHLSMNAFRLVCEAENLTITQMDEWIKRDPIAAVPRLIYYGMVNALHYAGDTDTVLPNFNQFAAHMFEDENTIAEYATLISVAMGGEEPVEPSEAEELGNAKKTKTQ
jgi:hypothetical protein